ncbi:MAG: hypothetical protein NVS9B14_21350 [Candidatus Acidiferrum sp.]
MRWGVIGEAARDWLRVTYGKPPSDEQAGLNQLVEEGFLDCPSRPFAGGKGKKKRRLAPLGMTVWGRWRA